MKCKVCNESHPVVSDGEDVPRYVRAACKCERREACSAKHDCANKVVAVALEPDGATIDSHVCHAHLPPGFDANDFKSPSEMVPIAEEEPPFINNFEPTEVTCAGCGHKHFDNQRYLFFGVGRSEEMKGKMIHRTGCPKCRSVLMNAV